MFGTVTRVVNATYLIRVQHKTRILVGSIIGLASFGLIALCCAFNDIPVMFYLSMLATVLVGIQCSLGESTTLGFLKGFPGETIGFYGSGTGFAGIFGSGSLILLKAIKVSDAMIFLLATPTIVPYFFCFWWLDK